jgi:transposase
MVVFFEEQDLVSFGTYLLSETRYELYCEKYPEADEDEITNRLSRVNEDDLADWSRYLSK